MPVWFRQLWASVSSRSNINSAQPCKSLLLRIGCLYRVCVWSFDDRVRDRSTTHWTSETTIHAYTQRERNKCAEYKVSNKYEFPVERLFSWSVDFSIRGASSLPNQKYTNLATENKRYELIVEIFTRMNRTISSLLWADRVVFWVCRSTRD